MHVESRTWEQCPHVLADKAREKRQIDPREDRRIDPILPIAHLVNSPKKARIPKLPGKEGKNTQKGNDIRCKDKNTEIQNSKARKSREGLKWPLHLVVQVSHGASPSGTCGRSCWTRRPQTCRPASREWRQAVERAKQELEAEAEEDAFKSSLPCWFFGGCKLWAVAGVAYAPLLYTSPTPRRVFARVGGWGTRRSQALLSVPCVGRLQVFIGCHMYKMWPLLLWAFLETTLVRATKRSTKQVKGACLQPRIFFFGCFGCSSAVLPALYPGPTRHLFRLFSGCFDCRASSTFLAGRRDCKAIQIPASGMLATWQDNEASEFTVDFALCK